ncbi:MAG: zinc-dependent alcohol dehydrogenase family protein [Rhodothermales bacterium]|nr:zinc-dependent alcohol dehydrogenase family protein [Rhodothermales bacterium]
MKAMLLQQISDLRVDPEPLTLAEVPNPSPSARDLLIRVSACGVCHTELDEIEGRTPPPSFPIIPGHQVVGRVHEIGGEVGSFEIGDRVGVGWIYSTCGSCSQCLTGDENLCSHFKATGRDANGGYAEYMVVPADSAYPIPDTFSDSEAAPLLCAGAIGYRSLRLSELQEGQCLGLTGFGASAHLVLRMVLKQHPGVDVFVFARNPEEREFALEIGAVWAGDTSAAPPQLLDRVIDTTPVWKPMVEALRHLAPGGRLVINAIRKEPADKDYLLRLEYETHLWHEKEIKSVANVARRDIEEFLELAATIPIRPDVEEFPLTEANRALVELRNRRIRGGKVLVLD